MFYGADFDDVVQVFTPWLAVEESFAIWYRLF